jgi:hypothetical protein
LSATVSSVRMLKSIEKRVMGLLDPAPEPKVLLNLVSNDPTAASSPLRGPPAWRGPPGASCDWGRPLRPRSTAPGRSRSPPPRAEGIAGSLFDGARVGS